MADLFSTGAGLIKGAADTTMQARSLDEDRRKTNLGALTAMSQQLAGIVGQKMQEGAAMERQQVIGRQAMDLERLKQEGEKIEISEPLASGLAKQTGDASWKEMVGQKMPTAQVMALYTVGLKSKVKPITYREGGKLITKMWDWDKEDWVESSAPRNVSETGFRPPSGGKDDDKNKRLTNLGTAIKGDFANINRFLEKNGDIPEEISWLKKLSKGKLGSLNPREKAQVASLRASVNRLRQNLTNEQTLTQDLGLELTDRSDVLAGLEAVEEMLPADTGSSKESPDDVLTVELDGKRDSVKRKDLAAAQQKFPGLKVVTP